MLLEWLRRNDDGFDRHLRAYLFSSGPIHESANAKDGGSSGLAIGSLRKG
jgi:hypothetical protein